MSKLPPVISEPVRTDMVFRFAPGKTAHVQVLATSIQYQGGPESIRISVEGVPLVDHEAEPKNAVEALRRELVATLAKHAAKLVEIDPKVIADAEPSSEIRLGVKVGDTVIAFDELLSR